MAGIESLLSGGLKTFGADKVSELNPQLKEILPFVLNPQGYIIGKAVNSLADYLGYGNEVKDLQAGAKDEKDYYKETMRDAIGDVLPGALGDFVRVTPKSESTEPSGTYWNSGTDNWEQSANPVSATDPFASARFDAGFNLDSQYNPNSENFVGPNDPKSMDSNIPQQNLAELYRILQQSQQPSNTIDEYGMPTINFADTSSKDTTQGKSNQDESDDLMTALTAFGGGAPEMREKGIEMMANGGFIYRGIR